MIHGKTVPRPVKSSHPVNGASSRQILSIPFYDSHVFAKRPDLFCLLTHRFVSALAYTFTSMVASFWFSVWRAAFDLTTNLAGIDGSITGPRAWVHHRGSH